MNEREKTLNKILGSKSYRLYVIVAAHLRMGVGLEPLPIHCDPSLYHQLRSTHTLPEDHGSHWSDLINPDHPLSHLRVDSPLSFAAKPRTSRDSWDTFTLCQD